MFNQTNNNNNKVSGATTRSLSKAGRQNALRAKTSLIATLMTDKPDNYRSQLEQRGIKPTNHHKQNLLKMRAKQQNLKLTQQQKIDQQSHKNRKLNKSKQRQFANINSKLNTNNTNNNNNSSDCTDSKENSACNTSRTHTQSQSQTSSFLKRNRELIKHQSAANQRNKNKNKQNKNQSAANIDNKRNNSSKKQIRKAAVPKRAEMNVLKTRQSKDFLSLNKKIEVVEIKSATEERFVNKKDYGQTPEYILQRRKDAIESEQRRLDAIEAAKIPKGMRQMSDEERFSTIEILNKNKEQVLHSIKLLPLVIETHSMKRRAAQLREKIQEIEDAIKLFSKQVVFVKKED